MLYAIWPTNKTNFANPKGSANFVKQNFDYMQLITTTVVSVIKFRSKLFTPRWITWSLGDVVYTSHCPFIVSLSVHHDMLPIVSVTVSLVLIRETDEHAMWYGCSSLEGHVYQCGRTQCAQSNKRSWKIAVRGQCVAYVWDATVRKPPFA